MSGAMLRLPYNTFTTCNRENTVFTFHSKEFKQTLSLYREAQVSQILTNKNELGPEIENILTNTNTTYCALLLFPNSQPVVRE